MCSINNFTKILVVVVGWPVYYDDDLWRQEKNFPLRWEEGAAPFDDPIPQNLSFRAWNVIMSGFYSRVWVASLLESDQKCFRKNLTYLIPRLSMLEAGSVCPSTDQDQARRYGCATLFYALVPRWPLIQRGYFDKIGERITKVNPRVPIKRF